MPPVPEVPTQAATNVGFLPAVRSAVIARFSASGRMAPESSTGISRRFPDRAPQSERPSRLKNGLRWSSTR